LKTRIPNLALQWAIILISLIAVSIACSTGKSAPTQPQLTESRLLSQAPSPVPSPAVQESSACTLKASEAPVFNGLKLGMTPEEILALFPGSKDDPELRSKLSAPPGKLGNLTFLLTPSKYGSAANYKEISRINISLLDARVSNFTINYVSPQSTDLDKFIEKVSKGKKLPPPDQWKPYEGMDTQMKTLECNGFSVRVFTGGEDGNQNYVLLQDLEADRKLKERRKKAREQPSPKG
jgi:hypothetical protein